MTLNPTDVVCTCGGEIEIVNKGKWTRFEQLVVGQCAQCHKHWGIRLQLFSLGSMDPNVSERTEYKRKLRASKRQAAS